MVVVLPAPLGPKNPKICPLSIARLTWLIPLREPYVRPRSQVSITVITGEFKPSSIHDSINRLGYISERKSLRAECPRFQANAEQTWLLRATFDQTVGLWRHGHRQRSPPEVTDFIRAWETVRPFSRCFRSKSPRSSPPVMYGRHSRIEENYRSLLSSGCNRKHR